MSGFPQQVKPTFDVGFAPSSAVTPLAIQTAVQKSNAAYAPYVPLIQNAVTAPLVQSTKQLASTYGVIQTDISNRIKRSCKKLEDTYGKIQADFVQRLALSYAYGMDFGIPVPGMSAGSQPAVNQPATPKSFDQFTYGTPGVGGNVTSAGVPAPAVPFPIHQVHVCACTDQGVCMPPGCNEGGGTGTGGGSQWFCYKKTDGALNCNVFGDGIPLPPDFQSIVSGPYASISQCQAACQASGGAPQKFYCVYQGAAGVNCVQCDGTVGSCNGDIVAGPFDTAEQCQAACSAIGNPPGGNWFCYQKIGDPQTTKCVQGLLDPQVPPEWRLLSGPYPDRATCQASCNVGVIGGGGGPPTCCPPAQITVQGSTCPPPVIQNLVTVNTGSGTGGGGTGGGGTPPPPCGETSPVCNLESSGESCPKPDGGDVFWYEDTCSDDYKVAIAQDMGFDPNGFGGQPLGQWVRDWLDQFDGVQTPAAEDPVFIE